MSFRPVPDLIREPASQRSRVKRGMTFHTTRYSPSPPSRSCRTPIRHLARSRVKRGMTFFFLGGIIRRYAPSYVGAPVETDSSYEPTYLCGFKSHHIFSSTRFLRNRINENGGEGGIRTHGTVARTLVFETSSFNQLGHLSSFFC